MLFANDDDNDEDGNDDYDDDDGDGDSDDYDGGGDDDADDAYISKERCHDDVADTISAPEITINNHQEPSRTTKNHYKERPRVQLECYLHARDLVAEDISLLSLHTYTGFSWPTTNQQGIADAVPGCCCFLFVISLLVVCSPMG